MLLHMHVGIMRHHNSYILGLAYTGMRYYTSLFSYTHYTGVIENWAE